MKTSINYSSFTKTTFFAVGKDPELVSDHVFDRFSKAIRKYPEITCFLETDTNDTIMFKIPEESNHAHLLINKIAMLSYEGCIYVHDGNMNCKKCIYKGYCDAVNGREEE